jgi:hypothetical protein
MKVETAMPVSSPSLSQKRICEKCGKREGNVYSFYFGKKKSRTTQRDGNRYIYKTSYAVGGKRDAVACDACIRRRRAIEAIQPALGIAASALFGWWVFFQEGLAGLDPKKDAGIRWIVTGLACMGLLIAIHELYLRLFENRSGPGERLIIGLKKDELRKQGFDSFWETARYHNLR